MFTGSTPFALFNLLGFFNSAFPAAVRDGAVRFWILSSRGSQKPLRLGCSAAAATRCGPTNAIHGAIRAIAADAVNECLRADIAGLLDVRDGLRPSRAGHNSILERCSERAAADRPTCTGTDGQMSPARSTAHIS